MENTDKVGLHVVTIFVFVPSSWVIVVQRLAARDGGGGEPAAIAFQEEINVPRDETLEHYTFPGCTECSYMDAAGKQALERYLLVRWYSP